MLNTGDIKSSKILVIDDDAVMRLLLTKILNKEGFLNVFEASDGREGLDKTLDIEPDLIFLDINMPVMDGFEYCREIRNLAKFKRTAILAQTGVTDKIQRKEIFAAGVTDFVNKPIDESEIIARTKVHLTNSLYLKRLEQYKDRINQELESAKRLVDITLPNEKIINFIKETCGLDVFSFFQSSSEMGGDFWSINKLSDSQIAIYIIDFSGHGVNAALNAARLDCLIKSSDEKAKDPALLLDWLNLNMYNLLPAEQFATVFYGVIDKEKSILTYTACGCPEMLILHDNGSCSKIDGSGFQLGAVKEANFENKIISFKKGDALFLYSDALSETKDNNGNYIDNIELELNKYKLCTNPAKRDGFDQLIHDFLLNRGANLTDDLTVVMCVNELS